MCESLRIRSLITHTVTASLEVLGKGDKKEAIENTRSIQDATDGVNNKGWNKEKDERMEHTSGSHEITLRARE